MGSRETCRFADFDLDLRTGELTRGGVPVALERQPAIALGLLVTRAGRLVTRDELRQAIWGADTHVDFDRGLNYCVRQVRLALGDGSKMPRFVETIPRQGYRFIAPVDDRQAAPPAAPPPVRAAPWRRVALIAAAASVGLILGAATSTAPEVEPAGRDGRHHRAAVALARSVHAAVFGAAPDRVHHEATRSAARALHDLVF
jgi:DNA-binding winged helix-turn-helix (wHTH) protein